MKLKLKQMLLLFDHILLNFYFTSLSHPVLHILHGLVQTKETPSERFVNYITETAGQKVSNQELRVNIKTVKIKS